MPHHALFENARAVWPVFSCISCAAESVVARTLRIAGWVSSDKSTETTTKLSVLEKTTNGLRLPKRDWELAGPGDLLCCTAAKRVAGTKTGDLRRSAAF